VDDLGWHETVIGIRKASRSVKREKVGRKMVPVGNEAMNDYRLAPSENSKALLKLSR
jgi:hypothetical protein